MKQVTSYLLGLGLLMVSQLHSETFSSAEIEFFEKKIRPVLTENCLSCHGAKPDKIKGGLYLTSRENLLEGGDSGPALVPGDPAKSLLIEAIHYKNVDLQMPPRDRLPDSVIKDMERWIANGAAWPASANTVSTKKQGFNLEERRNTHWVWSPIQNPAIPSVKNVQWPTKAMDHFILAELEKANLSPAAKADRRTLIRRATFDLTGLPPTPEEVNAFMQDPADGAFERVIDRLLRSPRFGERWARHWLDLTRYAESMGHEFDYEIHNAWMYRDYLIRAFDGDVPYDQLIKEHIAGDLIQKPRFNPDSGENESVVGTAFYWLPQQKHSPVDIRQEQSNLIDNQIDVLTKTFLGMTVSCARCHDHKFDAITTEDFYSLYGILSSSRFHLGSVTPEESIRKTAKEISKLKQNLPSLLAKQWSEETKGFPVYLKALNELDSIKSTDVIFEDFEKPLHHWEIEGDFDKSTFAPGQIAKHQGRVKHTGKRFFNSHNRRHDGKILFGDGFTGQLTSPPFTIDHDFIHFLIGGGDHKGKTALLLLIDGKPVAEANGKGDNVMAPGKFDVTQWKGKKAQLRIIDFEKGGWGNIGLDHIVFSDTSSHFDANNQPDVEQSRIAQLAKVRGLDQERLSNWKTAMANPPRHLKALSSEETEICSDAATSHVEHDGFLIPRDAEQLFYHGPATDDLLTEGPTLLHSQEGAFLSDGDWLNTGKIHPLLEGTIRTPTFKISKKWLHLYVAGFGGRANIMIENFTLIRNPIYGSLKQRINNPTPHWISIDMSMWQGRNVWIEFADNTGQDPAGPVFKGNGFIALKEVRFSDDKEFQKPTSVSSLPSGITADALNVAISKWQQHLTSTHSDFDTRDQSIINWLLTNQLISIEPNEGNAKLHALADKLIKLEERIPTPRRTVSMTDGTGQNEPIFIRGVHRNTGKEATRGFLSALPEIEKDTFKLVQNRSSESVHPVSTASGKATNIERSTYTIEGSGRHQLAEAIIHPDNPLTTRVAANRIWHHLMGRGIVPTTDDFGVLGERPSNQALLDHLATSFSENGWSVKSLIREIMLSSAYQMQSRSSSPDAETKDPTNRLWHRANIRRLQGEAIRDSLLFLSGQLNETMFGAPVPIHLTPFMQGRGRPRTSGPIDGDGRRSIYVAVRRNFLSPMMLAFDTPIPSTTIGRRTVSNVPAQALILMNDPFVEQQSRHWAERILAETSSDTERIEHLYESAFSRAPEPHEASQIVSYLKQNKDLAKEDKWTRICHVLINVKEFIFVP